VIVKGYYKKQVWFCTTSGEDITHLTENVDFRPLRTPEQRERQSVIEQAFSKLSEFHDADQVLGDLYDAGMLRKQED